MKKIFYLFAVLAIVGMAFVGCQKDDVFVPKKDNLVKNDKLLSGRVVEYTDLFDSPSGHCLKASMPHPTIYYKNFVTGHVRAYRAAYDYTHKQIWLAENFKEEQFFAAKSLKNPKDPDGSKYGYFYFYDDIEIEPKSVDVPWPPFYEKQWEFYWDSTLTTPINGEWRIPTLYDVNKLVEHLGDIQRAYSPTYGIDMRYTGWCIDGVWQGTIADCTIWLQNENNHTHSYDSWMFRARSYTTGYNGQPHVYFYEGKKKGCAYSMRLVADLQQ